MIQRSRFRPKLVMPLASAVFPLFQLETFLQIPEDMWQSLPEAPSTGVRPWQATHVGNASEVALQLGAFSVCAGQCNERRTREGGVLIEVDREHNVSQSR